MEHPVRGRRTGGAVLLAYRLLPAEFGTELAAKLSHTSDGAADYRMFWLLCFPAHVVLWIGLFAAALFTGAQPGGFLGVSDQYVQLPQFLAGHPCLFFFVVAMAADGTACVVPCDL